VHALLKRSIQKYVEDLLAEEIIKSKLSSDTVINIDWDGKSDSLKILDNKV
jgi:ATP-dependent Clp protease ATP-binding subunit ClpA